MPNTYNSFACKIQNVSLGSASFRVLLQLFGAFSQLTPR
jgi:hypothetical protein